VARHASVDRADANMLASLVRMLSMSIYLVEGVDVRSQGDLDSTVPIGPRT